MQVTTHSENHFTKDRPIQTHDLALPLQEDIQETQDTRGFIGKCTIPNLCKFARDSSPIVNVKVNIATSGKSHSMRKVQRKAGQHRKKEKVVNHYF
jgi:hypothetical protein